MIKEVCHHSRMHAYRTPQGALTKNTALTLTLHTQGAYKNASVSLSLHTPSGTRMLPMQAAAQDKRTLHTITITADALGLMHYSFALDRPGFPRVFYGGESGEGSLYEFAPPAYQVTVYDPDFQVPRWFYEGILYQIFPDRFCRAKPENAGTAHHARMGRSIRVHESWSDLPEYLPAHNAKHYAPNDFFLGDLLGIKEKLSYFKSLGVSLIYLNPVFESASNHRYDTADYLMIDPILGTNDEFRALTELFAQNGIRIMLDGVFSHTGADSVYFNKYGHYGEGGAYRSPSSPYRSWYDFHEDYASGYRTWWGFPELPEVNELDEAYLDFLMDGTHSFLHHWAAHGVSSWRLDVADELPDAFISRMRARLKAIDPESVLLGEVWEDASNKEAYGARRQYVLGHSLDSVMNYPFQNALIAFFLNEQSAFALHHALETLREHYPKPFYYALMNLLSTHDSVRALTMLGGAPSRDALTREQQAIYRLPNDMEQLGKKRLIAATALQMAMPGVPSIYYGDEAGVSGMADPFNRATYPWGCEDEALLEAFRLYAALRKSNDALRAGYCRMCAPAFDVFAVLRYTHAGRDAFSNPAKNTAVLCFVNRASLTMHLRVDMERFSEGPDAQVPFDLNGAWREIKTSQLVSVKNGVFETLLPPHNASVFVRECEA